MLKPPYGWSTTKMGANSMSCACDNSPGLMPIEVAHSLIQQLVVPIADYEACSLHSALGRILCEDILSPINVPAYDNSAMDGYALNTKDLKHEQTLTQIGKSFAGNPFSGRLNEGECVRIMTGAQIPEGADAVVMQENTTTNGNLITFTKPVTEGEAIRPAGDDIKNGSVVLPKGRKITPTDIGLLASIGIGEIPVLRQVVVALFSTGDELVQAGETQKPSTIYDSNRPMLVAMLERLGAKVLDMGIIKDDKKAIDNAFDYANTHADCVITSGGVSVGEADYTREILEEKGSIDFWKLAIKPGKPLAFGRLSDSIFFGLPGNPVSAAVTFDQVAAPALELLAGVSKPALTTFKAVAQNRIKKRPGRADYQRATYYINDQNVLCVETMKTQSSGVLSGFRDSNCYAVIEKERGVVEKGEEVIIQLFSNRIS